MTMNAIAIAIGAYTIPIPSPGFFLPLADAGAGAVNTTLGAGAGSATFTRATSATCWSSAGLLLTVGTGVARSTYTELTGAAYLGYLAEEARTNNCLWNRDFTNAAWVMTTMTPLKDQVGIDGAANSASSLLATGANATAAQTITIAAVNRPFSVYVKRLVGTGNIDLAQDGATFTNQTVANDGLWHRCTLVASQLNPVLTIRLATNADKIAVDYAALEDAGGAAAPFPLSPIATTTVAVTRNADQLTFASAGNILGAQGSAYEELSYAGTGSASGDARPLATTGNGGPILIHRANAHVEMYDNTNLNDSGLTISLNTVTKVAARWPSSAGKMRNYVAGAVGTEGTFAGDLTVTNPIAIGAGSYCGAIKNVKIWTVALTDGQIAAL